jgi:nucleoside-diphosphate-sugar epimerase
VSGYEGVRVIVLGASGFIGRWVAQKLQNAGANLYLLLRNPAVWDPNGIGGEVIEADLSDPAMLAGLYRRIRPSITFNLVGYGVDPAERDERLSYQINAKLPGAVCCAAAAVRDEMWRGQYVIHAGSAAEYGSAGGALSEDGPALPATIYGKSKLEGTRVVAACRHGLGLRCMTARLFTVYGPGEHNGRLLPSLIEAAQSGKPLDLTEGLQRRDFTYVEDIAEGLLRLGLTGGESEAVVNLATGQMMSVRTFIQTAATILGIPGSNLRFAAIPGRCGEMEHDPVSLNRLRQLLAWVPPVPVTEGIRRTLEVSLLKKSGPV